MNRVVELAKSYVGYNEADGTYKKFIELYNSQSELPRGYKVKESDPWCAIFVSAIAIELGMTNIIPTECGCEKMIERFKAIGCFVENDDYTPAIGDIIFYDWEDNGKGDNTGWSDHVGIIEKIGIKNFTVIEGNKNNAVGRRTVKINDKYIRGFGVPAYSSEDRAVLEPPKGVDVPTPGKINAPLKPMEEIVKEVIRGDWGNGEERVNRLNIAGYNAEEVQKAVNAELKVQSAGRYGTVRVNSVLNVRSAPTMSNNIIGTLRNGTRVKIESQQGGWYKISEPRDGWVSAYYIK